MLDGQKRGGRQRCGACVCAGGIHTIKEFRMSSRDCCVDKKRLNFIHVREYVSLLCLFTHALCHAHSVKANQGQRHYVLP